MSQASHYMKAGEEEAAARQGYRTCKNSVVARFFPVGPANAHQNSGFHSKLIKSTQLLDTRSQTVKFEAEYTQNYEIR